MQILRGNAPPEEENLIINVLISSNSHFSSLLSYANNPQIITRLAILVTLCIWVLGQARGTWRAHGVP